MNDQQKQTIEGIAISNNKKNALTGDRRETCKGLTKRGKMKRNY